MATDTMSKQVTLSCSSCETLSRIDLARLNDGPRCAACGRPFLLDRPQALPGDALARIIAEADVPVLVDFYADWCGPCRRMAPVLDDMARDWVGEVLVGKVDTDRHPYAAVRFAVRSIPTLIVFSGGREVAREVGVVPRRALEALLAPRTASSTASPTTDH